MSLDSRNRYNNVTANYANLTSYSPSLGVPVLSATPKGIQILPIFNGVSYENPNYNSLTLGSCCNNYPSVTQGYMDGNCVKYNVRECDK